MLDLESPIINCCQQYSDEWKRVRRGVPSASNFKRIITPKTWELASGHDSYINDLIADIHDPYYGQHEEYVSKAMQLGTLGEPESRAMYAKLKGIVVEQVGFVTTFDGRFGCSPDSLVGTDGGLELKCPEPSTHVGYLRAGVVPAEYLPQVEGCLWITGRSWWDFMSWAPGFPEFRITVHRSARTEKLGEVLEEFYPLFAAAKKKVAAMIPPPVAVEPTEEPIIIY